LDTPKRRRLLDTLILILIRSNKRRRKFQIAWLWRLLGGADDSNANKGQRSRMLIENQDDDTAAAKNAPPKPSSQDTIVVRTCGGCEVGLSAIRSMREMSMPSR
jgi:hypothetical protein